MATCRLELCNCYWLAITRCSPSSGRSSRCGGMSKYERVGTRLAPGCNKAALCHLSDMGGQVREVLSYVWASKDTKQIMGLMDGVGA